MTVKCPECGSKRIWKDGIRYVTGSKVQRYLCRSCGYRFSDPEVKVDILKQSLELSDSMHDFGDLNSVNVGVAEVGFQDSAFTVSEDVSSHSFSVVGKTINKFLPYNRERQVCVSDREAKNLIETESRIKKRPAGATKKTTKADIKGKIVEFMWWMKKQGYAESTIIGRTQLLRILVDRNANLFDPESIKDNIAKQSWSEGRKNNAVVAYTTFLRMQGSKWNPPRYRQEEKLPFIPLESEIDQLISGCSLKVSCFLQMLKETAMRPGEAWRLTWRSIDTINRIITLNRPEKHSNPRQFRISPKLVDMLQNIHQMQSRADRVVNYTSLASIRRTFEKQRKRIAFKTCNPRIMQISFRTLRHWKASIEYQKTKDILWVKKLLGHKRLENTMIYTHLINAGEDTYISRVAVTTKEICELVDKGFEYVCEHNGAKVFRKQK